jgi:hypothetical protein
MGLDLSKLAKFASFISRDFGSDNIDLWSREPVISEGQERIYFEKDDNSLYFGTLYKLRCLAIEFEKTFGYIIPEEACEEFPRSITG